MKIRSELARIVQQEDINFLLTNRIPRRLATQFIGWFSKIEQPLVRDLSIACWRLFSDLDLSEARKTHFRSLHDCFTRELKPGLRPSDPDPKVVVSPCDAIIGAFGRIADTELFQVKGAPYSLLDLLGDPALVDRHRNGRFITLRLTSSMYHRFHAPHDCRIENPYVARASIALWRLFADLDLGDSKLQTFDSLHACFTRELKPGARRVDPDPHLLASPCDGIVGACGRIEVAPLGL